MKKIYLILIAICSNILVTNAQWTTNGNNISNSNSGNVGIGTTTPAAPLDINGALAMKGSVIRDEQSITTNSDGTYVVASGSRLKGTYTLNFEAANRVQTVVLLVNATQYDLGSYITVLGNKSYSGSTVMSNFRLVWSQDNSTVYLLFDITNRVNGNMVMVHFDGIGVYNPNWGGTLPSSYNTGGYYPLTVTENRVGINTANPQGYQLAVNGSAIATSMTVKLQANWPDYVFTPTYTLPTLGEVKTYIDQNHHLPEIPSEQEVIKKGINLGEMNTLLMKKVEELTLYLIEKDKAINNQNEMIKQLASRLEKLEQGRSNN